MSPVLGALGVGVRGFGFSSPPAGVDSAFEIVSTTILSSGATSATLDVSGLSATYKHLQLRINGAWSNLGTNYMTFNSDTTETNYSTHQWYAGGTFNAQGAAGIGYASNSQYGYVWNAGNVGGAIIDLYDVFSTNKYKTSRSHFYTSSDGSGGAGMLVFSHMWQNTNAVTSINLRTTSGTMNTGTRISVYGVR